MSDVSIYGFTFIKDGVRYDYPFRESLNSISKLVSKVYMAVGKNDDGTSKVLEEYKFIKTIPTVWNPELMGSGGLIFSEQTNVALDELKNDFKEVAGSWGLYLQGDELIHEEDLEQIKKDFQAAEDQACDAIRFRYFHFWLDHQHIAINKRWYAHEIRGVKLNSNVCSYGDAQGFEGETKVYESDVHIYHYGHVRDKEKREEKQKDLIRQIRPNDKFSKYLKREKKAFGQTKTVSWWGSHPAPMKERVERLGDSWSLPIEEKVYIVGEKSEFSKDLLLKMNAKEVLFVNSIGEVPNIYKTKAITLRPTFFQRLFSSSKVPDGMESELAREWDKKTKQLLLLSEKGISLKRN
jgi:hypothetical protein